MSTSGITSSMLSQIAGSPSTANQFVTDLNQLTKDLGSGNLSASQQDWVTLSQDALDGQTASTATTSSSGITAALLSGIAGSSTSSSSFANALNQLGTDLGNGNLSSAQGDLLSLDSTALNAAAGSGSGTTGSSASNKADSAALISATVQAIDAGDNSAVGTDMSLLASDSTSSAGASFLKSTSESFGASSGSASSGLASSGSASSSSASSISELFNNQNTNDSSGSGSLISLYA